MESENVFKKACLIQLTTSNWQGTRMLDQGIMEKLGKSSEWLRGRKYLINPELLGPIHTSTHQARNLVQQYSLPFPITSIYLIPKESLSLVDERLTLQKEKFHQKVEEFIGIYDQAREEAKEFLGNLFNETDYPVDIRSKFRFEWRFLALELPRKGSILSPEIYEREKQKFESMMQEARELAAVALREELAEIVNHLVGKLNGNGSQPRTLKGSMFNKLHEFLDDLSTRNIFNDEKLAELAEEARAAVNGVSPYGLNYNESMKGRIKASMDALKVSIDEAIEDLPKRKIRLAPAVSASATA